ncbi:hypothetical protein ABZP36_026647 [Zizania latifolia]
MMAGPCEDVSPSNQMVDDIKQNNGDITQQNEHAKEVENRSNGEVNAMPAQSPAQSAEQQGVEHYVNKFHDAIAPVRRSISQLIRYKGRSVVACLYRFCNIMPTPWLLSFHRL